MSHLKALPIILAVAVVLYWMAAAAFPEANRLGEIRRQRWALILVTCASFLAPSIWVYAAMLVAILLAFLLPGGARAPRAAALWAGLLLAVPNVGAYIGGIGGIGNFFEIEHARMLSFALLLPAILMAEGEERRPLPLAVATDWFVLAYFTVQIVVLAPFSSRTDLIRQAFVLTIDTLLPYWVFSRAAASTAALRNVLRAFVLTGLLIATLAVFESIKRWPLYDSVPEGWNLYWDLTIFLERAGFLRAKASAGHSLVLGFVLVVALGFWAQVRTEVPRKGFRLLGTLALVAGLAASLARGSWVGAVVLVLLQSVLGEGAFKRLLLAGVVGLAFVGIATQVPALHFVIDMLPFVGHVDSENVEYRQRLLEISLGLIANSPMLGVPGYLNYMEELRQGQGIIDIVNSYLAVALNTGLVGLACFLGIFGATLASLWRVRRFRAQAPDDVHLANHLIATIIAALVIIFTTSSIVVIPQILYMLAGLGVACVRVHALHAATRPLGHRLAGVPPVAWGSAIIPPRQR